MKSAAFCSKPVMFSYRRMSLNFIILILIACVAGQQETLTGTFTIEQPGSGNCVTFVPVPANNVLDDDRVVITRCREHLRSDGTTQTFTVSVVLDEGKAQFSVATADQKCFYGDTQNDLRRSKNLCDISLNYFVAERATGGRGGSDILIKQWPSDKCLSGNLDGTVNLVGCEPGNSRQKWRVCRSDDSESCLRYFER